MLPYTTYTDAYLREESGMQFICYRTGALVYEEILGGGQYYAGYRNHAGFVPQTVTVPGTYHGSPELCGYPRAFELAVNGRELGVGYSLLSFEKTVTEGILHVAVTLANRFEPIKVTLHTYLDGTTVIQRGLTLTNESDSAMPLGRISVMSGGLFYDDRVYLPAERFRFGYMMDSSGCGEGDYHVFDLPRGEFSFGRTLPGERHRSPFFTVEDKASGVFAIGQLGFSGGFGFRFRNYSLYGTSTLSFRADLGGDMAPVLVLAPHEEFDTPDMHLCMIAGGLDDAVNQMNDHMRIYTRKYRKDLIIEKAIGPEIDMSLDMVLRSIDDGARMGAEVYFIDAAWYSPAKGEFIWNEYCGDWDPAEFRYEMPMTAIRDYAHERGMKFGLWGDVEKIGPKSSVYETAYPPKLRDMNGGWLMDDTCHCLDISCKEGADWAFDTISSMIDRYGLEFFRVDSGAYPYCACAGPDGGSEARDLRYYGNWYSIFRRLREKYPDVIFQNCAGGGARIDFGMMEAMSNTQLTDQQTAPMIFRVLNGVSMQLPCEYFIEAFVACNGHLHGSARFLRNICRFGNPQIGWNTLPEGIGYNPAYEEGITRVMDAYRTLIRPILPGCRIYHHTPEADELARNSVGILELAAADRSLAMVGVFTLTRPDDPCISFRIRGVDPAARYRILVEDEPCGELSGHALATDGYSVRIEAALDSVSVIALRID